MACAGDGRALLIGFGRRTFRVSSRFPAVRVAHDHMVVSQTDVLLCNPGDPSEQMMPMLAVKSISSSTYFAHERLWLVWTLCPKVCLRNTEYFQAELKLNPLITHPTRP